MRLESLAKKVSVCRALRHQSSLETTTLLGTYVRHVFEVCVETAGEDSTAVRDRVVAASETQVARFSANRATCNADMSAREVAEFCKLTPRRKQVLETAMRQLHLSARAYHRVIKVARTIADLDHADRIDTPHVAEALQYRRREGD